MLRVTKTLYIHMLKYKHKGLDLKRKFTWTVNNKQKFTSEQTLLKVQLFSKETSAIKLKHFILSKRAKFIFYIKKPVMKNLRYPFAILDRFKWQ